MPLKLLQLAIVALIFSIVTCNCDAPSTDPDAIPDAPFIPFPDCLDDDATPCNYTTSWTCEAGCDGDVEFPFLDVVSMELDARAMGGFFWLRTVSNGTYGGQVVATSPRCWDLVFAGWSVSSADACVTGQDVVGTVVYLNQVQQRETIWSFAGVLN